MATNPKAKARQRSDERVWGWAGTHALDIAKRDSFGPGHHDARVGKRWCFKCETDQPLAGGKRIGPIGSTMWKCATCQPKKETKP